jgi:hypothetical protein
MTDVLKTNVNYITKKFYYDWTLVNENNDKDYGGWNKVIDKLRAK